MSEFLNYWQQHGHNALLSLPYFAAAGILGLHLAMRRAVLYGLLVTKASQIAFLAGFSLFLPQGSDLFTIISDAGLQLEKLDAIVFLFLLLLTAPFAWIAAYGGNRIRDSFWALALVSLTGLLPLINRALGNSEPFLASLYFSDLLLTPSSVFVHYLWHVIPAALLLLYMGRIFFVNGADPVQARLLGQNTGFWNFLFFLLSGMIVLVVVRALGIEVAWAALVAPGFWSMIAARSLNAAVLVSLLLPVVIATAGYSVSFAFPQLPASPVIIVVFSFTALIAYFFRTK